MQTNTQTVLLGLKTVFAITISTVQIKRDSIAKLAVDFAMEDHLILITVETPIPTAPIGLIMAFVIVDITLMSKKNNSVLKLVVIAIIDILDAT